MGVTAVCTGCRQTFRIGSARPPFTWKPTSLAEDSWIGVSPPEEKKEIKHCIICDAPLDEGAVRCLACGAKQITGLVHKSRHQTVKDVKIPIWALLPIKPVLAVLAVVLVGAGIFLAIQKMFSAAVQEGVEMAQVRVIRAAAQPYAAGMDPDEFAVTYAGRVDDRNLPRALEMLNAGDPMIRAAAAPLIACGNVTQVEPIVTKARSDDDAEAAGAVRVLHAIGPRRLVELSCEKDEQLRGPAAEALCLLFRLNADEQTLAALSAAGTAAEKIELLNRLCRPRPLAVGRFAIHIEDHTRDAPSDSAVGAGERASSPPVQTAPMLAVIEQLGRTFYLKLGHTTFVSDFNAERTFTIPVEKWCAATGVAVDPKEVRNWISGTITLSSPLGSGWQGEARVKALQKLASPPPGFLPVGKLERNDIVTLPVVLEQR
jgi:hypothetical protein